MAKKIQELIYVTTCNLGTDDEYQVITKSAEDAFDSQDGDCAFAVYEKVRDVKLTRTVTTSEEKV